MSQAHIRGMTTENTALEVKRRNSAHLRSLAGVCAVGVEKDEAGDFVLAVHLDETIVEAGEDVPDLVEGVIVVRLRGGAFRKL